MNNMFYYPPYPFEEDEIRDNSELFSIKETLEYGNLFKKEYSQYKNYKPCRIKENELINLMAMDDYVHDLKLYLDIYPNDKNMENIYLNSKMKYEEMKKNVSFSSCPSYEESPLKYLL